jgi:uncharacterized protein HemX
MSFSLVFSIPQVERCKQTRDRKLNAPKSPKVTSTFFPGFARGMSKYLAIFAILLFCQLAAAQFGFFEQMFQGGQQQQQQQQQQRQRPPGADHWRAQADAGKALARYQERRCSHLSCDQFLALRTFVLIPWYAWTAPRSAPART